MKCLPIYCLILFVILTKGFKDLSTNSYFKLRLIVALFFSSLGDLFLNIDMFEVGVGCFAVAQIFFIWCFGFQPRRFRLGIALYVLCLVVNIVLMQFNDEVLLIVFVFIYSYLLVTTTWRGLAGCQKWRTFSELPALAGAIGGVSFLLSDAILGVNMFVVKSNLLTVSESSGHWFNYLDQLWQLYRIPIESLLVVPRNSISLIVSIYPSILSCFAHQIGVMITYYLAELGLALTCVDTKAINKSVHIFQCNRWVNVAVWLTELPLQWTVAIKADGQVVLDRIPLECPIAAEEENQCHPFLLSTVVHSCRQLWWYTRSSNKPLSLLL